MESKPLGGSCIGDKECVLDRACALESGSIKPTLSDTRRPTVMVVVSWCLGLRLGERSLEVHTAILKRDLPECDSRDVGYVVRIVLDTPASTRCRTREASPVQISGMSLPPHLTLNTIPL